MYEIGKKYWIPCIELQYKKYDFEEIEDYMDRGFMDRVESYGYTYIPIYNHPHSDKENGQDEIHYHRDTRFNIVNPQYFPNFAPTNIRINNNNCKIVNKYLECVRLEEKYKTPVHLISKSKLKHKCIYKGKCPHRGYDLSNEIAVEGIITCPLHSLKFDANTKQLINS